MEQSAERCCSTKMRILITLFVSLVIFVIGVVYTLSQPKLYEAKGRVEVFQGTKPDAKGRIPPPPTGKALDVLNSGYMVMQIPNRLSGEERERLFPPYADHKDEKEIMRELYRSEARAFHLLPDTNIIEVAYRHPDPEIAATVVNAYMKELIDYFLKLGIDSSMKEVEDLRLRADHENEVIAHLANELAALEVNAASASEDELTQIARIREELEEKRKSYEFLVGEMTTEKTVIYRGSGLIKIIDYAMIPEKHMSPNIPLWIAGSILAGIFGGVISFFLIGKFRT